MDKPTKRGVGYNLMKVHDALENTTPMVAFEDKAARRKGNDEGEEDLMRRRA